MKVGLLALTKGGRELAARIGAELPESRILEADHGVAGAFRENWTAVDAFVCIMAAGIAVRSVAQLLQDKRHDPAVIVLDERGNHVISLLSGHLGGGNALARSVARITGGTPVITTASDTLGLVSFDLWAAHQQLQAAEFEVFTRASSILVNHGTLRIYCDEITVAELPPGLRLADSMEEADLVISHRLPQQDRLTLHPRNLVVGVGCNRNTPEHEFDEAVGELLGELGISPLAIRNLASIDVKHDEQGLVRFAKRCGWPIAFFSREQINTTTGVSISNAAWKAVGAIGVAEPTALLSAQTTQLLSRKRKWQNITLAVAKADFTLSAQVLDHLST